LVKEDKRSQSLQDLLKLAPDTETVEFTVTFILNTAEEGSKVLDGVPTIGVKFI